MRRSGKRLEDATRLTRRGTSSRGGYVHPIPFPTNLGPYTNPKYFYIVKEEHEQSNIVYCWRTCAGGCGLESTAAATAAARRIVPAGRCDGGRPPTAHCRGTTRRHGTTCCHPAGGLSRDGQSSSGRPADGGSTHCCSRRCYTVFDGFAAFSCGFGGDSDGTDFGSGHADDFSIRLRPNGAVTLRCADASAASRI